MFKFHVCAGIVFEQLAAPLLDVLPNCTFSAPQTMIISELSMNACGITAILPGQ